MSLQDRSVVRSAADLERKYNLAKLVGLAGNIETNSESLIKVENELNNFISSTADSLEEIQKQIDGNITTYYYSGVPTLSNLPTSEWPVEEYTNHIGDLYYDKDTGYAYRFIYDGETNVYSWLEISDNSVSEALALANAAKDTADSKRRVFVSQPTTPYDNGDLWVQGTNGDIMVCQLARATGNYDSGDWIVASKYTDNTYAKAIVDEMGGTTTEVLGGTVTQYTKNWVKFTDLQTGSSTTIAGDLIKTGTIDASKVKIANNNVVIDADGIKLNNGAKVVGENGLLNTYLYQSWDEQVLCGYEFINDISEVATGLQNENVVVNIVIPKGLKITKATVKLIHTPFLWNTGSWMPVDDYWGWCRSLKLFKANNLYSRHGYGVANGHLFNGYGTTDTEIVGAFGAEGWTPTDLSTFPTTQIPATEETISIDIKNELVEGLNSLIIKSDEKDKSWQTIPSIESEEQAWEVYNQITHSIAERKAMLIALANIEGYMTYE